MRIIKTLLSAVLIAALMLPLGLPAFAASEPTTVKSILEAVNAARKKEGLDPLKWDDDLAEAAKIRAAESAAKYSTTHKRPNGQAFFSVSTKVWAENTSWGQASAAEAMRDWLSSSGHTANILDERMTIFAAAHAVSDSGQTYWVQNFGTGKSNYTWAMKDFGVKTFTLDPFNNPATPLDKSSTGSSSSKLINDKGAVVSSALTAEIKKTKASASGVTTVRLKNAQSISAAALKAAAQSGKSVKLQFDTMTSNGKSVQGRMIVEPAKLTNRKTGINPGVYVDSKSVANIKKAAEAKFSGAAMAYIHMEHQGSLTASTKILAKVSLTGLDTKNLLFYVFDIKTGSITKLENSGYSIDKNKYLSFNTVTGGDIIITDKPLEA